MKINIVLALIKSNKDIIAFKFEIDFWLQFVSIYVVLSNIGWKQLTVWQKTVYELSSSDPVAVSIGMIDTVLIPAADINLRLGISI